MLIEHMFTNNHIPASQGHHNTFQVRDEGETKKIFEEVAVLHQKQELPGKALQ